MPRTRISRDLGPLPRTALLRSAGDRTGHLLQVVRSLALKNQREQPRVFYSLREVANRFNVPVSTVNKVYRDLEEEGLLNRVRGSKTILSGLRYNRRRVRAFIALPALLSNFVAIPEYRNFFLSIRHELWLRGFASNMVFFQPDEAADGTLRNRLKDYQVDAVIWIFPGRSAKDTILRLVDTGVRVVGITSIGTPTMPARYFVWREQGIATLVNDWKNQQSSRSFTVVDAKDYASAITEELLLVIMGNFGVKPVRRAFKGENAAEFLRGLSLTQTSGIIIPSAGLASMFAFQHPYELANLLKTHRVGFLDGAIDLPFVDVPDVLVDVVTFDWSTVAESIVNDLITLAAFDQNKRTVFHARAQLRIPLRDISQTIRPLRAAASVY